MMQHGHALDSTLNVEVELVITLRWLDLGFETRTRTRTWQMLDSLQV